MAIIRVIGKIILDDQQQEKLNSLGADLIATDNPVINHQKNEVVERIADAEVIVVNAFCKLPAKTLKQCPRLKFIQSWSTGLDHIDLEYCSNHNIQVKNVVGFSTIAVAQKSVALILMAAGRIQEAHTSIQAGHWDYSQYSGFELKGKNVCIIGYGAIGKQVAKFLTSFDVNIIPIHSRSTTAELHEALRGADVVSLHCPLNDATRHILNEASFALTNKAIIINAARGGVLCETALLNAISRGNVTYACLDVLEQEPPARNNPILNHNKIYVTPHTTWNTLESVATLGAAVVANVASYIDRMKS